MDMPDSELMEFQNSFGDFYGVRIHYRPTFRVHVLRYPMFWRVRRGNAGHHHLFEDNHLCIGECPANRHRAIRIVRTWSYGWSTYLRTGTFSHRDCEVDIPDDYPNFTIPPPSRRPPPIAVHAPPAPPPPPPPPPIEIDVYADGTIRNAYQYHPEQPRIFPTFEELFNAVVGSIAVGVVLIVLFLVGVTIASAKRWTDLLPASAAVRVSSAAAEEAAEEERLLSGPTPPGPPTR